MESGHRIPVPALIHNSQFIIHNDIDSDDALATTQCDIRAVPLSHTEHLQ